MRVSINIIAQFISCMMISGIAFADSGIMSKYGTIQGVDGYSTNPFGSSNTSTYSNRMPVPVYENGPDVQTDECLKIVSNFVSAQCNALNNCADTSLADIRPAIILQLSRMSGGNYATSCSGYLDEIFRQYKQAHQTPGASATFPTPSTTAKAATTNTNKSAVPLNNFFDAQKPAWAIEMQERTTELAEFQADNDRFYPELVPMDFPKTYADLSFAERMANNKAGYEPYQGKSAFKPIQVEDLDKYEKRQDEIAKAKQDHDKTRMKIEDFCEKYPNDPTCVQRAADIAAAEEAKKAAEEAEKLEKDYSSLNIDNFMNDINKLENYLSDDCKRILEAIKTKISEPKSKENFEQITKLLTDFTTNKCKETAQEKYEALSIKCTDVKTNIDSLNELLTKSVNNTTIDETHINLFTTVKSNKATLQNEYDTYCTLDANAYIPKKENIITIIEGTKSLSTKITNQISQITNLWGKTDEEWFLESYKKAHCCDGIDADQHHHLETPNETCAVCLVTAYIKYLIPDINEKSLICTGICKATGDDYLHCSLQGFTTIHSFKFNDICD